MVAILLTLTSVLATLLFEINKPLVSVCVSMNPMVTMTHQHTQSTTNQLSGTEEMQVTKMQKKQFDPNH